MEFGPVSVKMAREQDLDLNPAKTSGLCGRLKCCIAYEHGQEKTGEKRNPNAAVS
jgi:cell fate regulator YaaT (PSP1 superfamily)